MKNNSKKWIGNVPFKDRKTSVSCMHFLYSKNIGEKNGEKTEKIR